MHSYSGFSTRPKGEHSNYSSPDGFSELSYKSLANPQNDGYNILVKTESKVFSTYFSQKRN
jgi:hypothetical protein